MQGSALGLVVDVVHYVLVTLLVLLKPVLECRLLVFSLDHPDYVELNGFIDQSTGPDSHFEHAIFMVTQHNALSQSIIQDRPNRASGGARLLETVERGLRGRLAIYVGGFRVLLGGRRGHSGGGCRDLGMLDLLYFLQKLLHHFIY